MYTLVIKQLRKSWQLFLLLVFSAAFSAILYKIYIPRINAFGCFDDCNNFIGGYFLLHGKKLFSEVFFNHAPGMAYISFLIQYIFHPQNLYELILRHRQFVLAFSCISNALLLFRFRWKAIFFILLYEITKFYVFGDRFLAEAIIIYPVIYLAGLALERIHKKSLYVYEYILSVLATWFIIFTREPYIPLALFLFFVILFLGKKEKRQIAAGGVFICLSLLTLFYFNIFDLIFNVFIVNIINIQGENNVSHILGVGIIQSFFYPLVILFSGTQSIFRYLLIALSTLFLSATVVGLYRKRYKDIFFIWVTLGLANLRLVYPGEAFYGAFHMLIWYGLFLFFSFTLVRDGFPRKQYQYLFLGMYVTILVFFISFKGSYLHEAINQQTEFITNYGSPLQTGNVIGALSTADDTLFLDGFDDIIYWVADRQSSYPYAWYTSLMPEFPQYQKARLTMFQKSPPDFYYGSCPNEKNSANLLPRFIKNQYTRLNNGGKPSCLWIKQTKLPSISLKQWQKAKELLYTLPE